MDQEQKSARKLPIEQRCRSVPYRRPFVVAVLCSLIFYFGLLGFVTAAISFFLSAPDERVAAAYIFAGMLPVCGILWAVSFFKRRKANCPLCKSTPFLDNLARKHQKAVRFKPFNYGTTAIFNVLITQRWRCMYCGTPFDILKRKK